MRRAMVATGLWLVSVGVAGATPVLTAADAARIVEQAVAEAEAVGLPSNIVVVDREGNVLAAHAMDGAPRSVVVTGGGRAGQGLERVFGNGAEMLGLPLPDGANVAILAAMSKAGTAAFFSTRGNAFSTRTAGFIIQPHFPPGVKNTRSGPLFGVQFSQLPCGDVVPRAGGVTVVGGYGIPDGTLPLGLSADPGGLPLYLGRAAVGGVGVEGDGRYGIDRNPRDEDQPKEERIAFAATRGFRPPSFIRGSEIVLDGVRFPFNNVTDARTRSRTPVPSQSYEIPPRDAPPSRFVPQTLGRSRGTIDPRYFPARDSQEPSVDEGGLTAAEVTRLLQRAARRANKLRAAIRRPLGSRSRVNIAIVDAGGNVLGLYRTRDAPTFGFDVSVQKARTTVFMSSATAGGRLRAEGEARAVRGVVGDELTPFVERARRDGLRLDGSVAFSDRSVGFMSRPFFPDGIDREPHGPFSRPINPFSVFNNGLQVELVKEALALFFLGEVPLDCTGIAGLGNGMQIFAGSVPHYRRGRLVGGAGVSGDGIEQDDFVAVAASRGFAAPNGIRADRVRVRGVRLPWVKFPRRAATR